MFESLDSLGQEKLKISLTDASLMAQLNLYPSAPSKPLKLSAPYISTAHYAFSVDTGEIAAQSNIYTSMSYPFLAALFATPTDGKTRTGTRFTFSDHAQMAEIQLTVGAKR